MYTAQHSLELVHSLYTVGVCQNLISSHNAALKFNLLNGLTTGLSMCFHINTGALPFQFFVHDLRVKQISCTHNTGALPFQFFVHDLRVKQISCTHKHRYYTTYLQTCSTGRSTRDYAGVMLVMSLYMHMPTNLSLLLSLTCTAFYVLQ